MIDVFLTCRVLGWSLGGSFILPWVLRVRYDPGHLFRTPFGLRDSAWGQTRVAVLRVSAVPCWRA